ncbi:c-type cytochrome biogenesis protein CcmI [Roseicyclus sp. F158]|uniref:C-type cytochrome biogenesis protein CcmI n=1 Tax=Tropicimonas omnivorans TaxID=3075590 RepID=A0ABU3DNM5_9RHOB|nr:c-type cytochrome biogenesis protein CcmI [Roseicyclus sp. F158]MDT0684687.1 c-type cytochrome biogenesis protein CcmI [Roseicyclus sp. F158]
MPYPAPMFWLAALALAVVTALWITRPLLVRPADAQAPEAPDIEIYRQQLAALDRDVARGTIAPDEADRMRPEIERRLLDADRRARPAPEAGPRRAGRIAAGVTGLVLLAGGAASYLALGAPGYADLPLATRIADAERARASRPSQEELEAVSPANDVEREIPEDYAELMVRLRSALEQRPNDVEGLTLLARNEARTGDFAAAADAQGRLIEAKGEDATADDYSDLADLLALAAGGVISPEAERAAREALALDPRNGPARYYLGVMHAQTGRPDITLSLWDALLRQGPEDAPWIPAIRGQIDQVAARAGANYTAPTPPQSLPGPGAADLDAAADLSAEERDRMVRGMVDGLAGRLAADGGTPEEWARLIRALGVLGETERAAAIWTEAQGTFPASDIGPIRAAAEDAGVAE